MAPRKSHHVVHNTDGGWNSKKGGSPKVIKHFVRKEDAIDFTRTISQNQRSELVIHGRDGKIQQSDSHGNDPCPPKDKD
jgi:hypothetical protein